MSSSFINLVYHGLTITSLPLGVVFFKLNFDTFLSLHLATQFSGLHFVFVQTKSLYNQNVDSFIICKQCHRWNCEATTNKSNNLLLIKTYNRWELEINFWKKNGKWNNKSDSTNISFYEIIQIGINIYSFKFTWCSKAYKPYRIIVIQIENS